MGKKAVFLDRDGLLIEENGGNPIRYLEGIREFCAVMRDTFGYTLIMITNQPDISRGRTTRDQVDRINTTIANELGIIACYCCPHDDADHCDCRKPKAGLILLAAKDHDIELSESIMIGDRWTDVQAGIAAGCRTVYCKPNRVKDITDYFRGILHD